LSKRFARTIVLAVLALAMALPSVAMAAPSQSQSLSAPWYARWMPFPIWAVEGQVPARGTGLRYQMVYNAEKNEVQLMVLNATKKDITVTTPTAFTTDFALWKDGVLVWRYSTDRSFAEIVTKETIKAGQGKVYKQELPNLPAGTYLAQSYYIGETKRTPVASTSIVIRRQQTSDPLQYTVEYLAAGWFNSSPRLRVTIKNTSDKDLKLPYQWGYQVLVKVPGAKDYLGNVGIGQSIGTIEAGATRYVFVPLNGLAPGTYQVDVRSNIGEWSAWNYRTVAQTWLYIGR
jgi:hypothetical protein